MVSLRLKDFYTVWAWKEPLSHWYRNDMSYILRVGCIAAGISYCADNGYFTVFDLRARDVYGKSHAWGTWSVRYIIYRQLSASLSKFIWSNWSVWTKRFTNYKMWCGNKQQCKRGIKEIWGQHKCYKDHCFAVVLYSMLLNHFTL